ncbi:MAG: peptide chain release factor 1 [Dehalococcoidia bacterium]|nr:peptide chain release factor 1 [Dehalococcoidia bacterium]
MLDRLRGLVNRYEEITAEMGRPEVASDYERLQTLARERASLEEIVALYQDYEQAEAGIQQARDLLEESQEQELRDLAREELERLNERKEALTERIRKALVPPDPRDEKSVIMEIRAGTGGEEAALFAADLFRMYTRYADRHNWGVEVMSRSESGVGGFKEIIFEVKGRGAFSRLKYESGVHRVQRVPLTEAQGRIHTSTATVAVLPEAEEVDVKINEDELRVDIFHSGGPGGQNVQKVATAVRLTHIPTGIVVVCQDERSQWKNRVRAMAVLRARLLDAEQRRQAEEIGATRRSQVGTGERAEKIRTYNFPQDRVTDHRVGLTLHNLQGILDGDIDPIIDAVATEEQARLLEEQLV